MKGQYEQQCNAAALRMLGVPVIKSLKKKYRDIINKWLEDEQHIPVNYPDNTENIISMIFEKHSDEAINKKLKIGEAIVSVKKLKEMSLGKILTKLTD
jgi:hypothetical protein